jgi:soluble lytic murein transglycosylase
MDMRVEASKEWAWALRGFDDRQLLIASEVAQRNNMYDRSIMAAERTQQMHDFNLRYPAPYRDVLQSRLREHGLEEAWVYGLMRQESRFATHAKSDVGAAGLMQIMPATARWVAKRLGMRDYRKALLHQMDVNLKLGTYYMKNVLSSLDNNPVLASAAYNAGPGRARDWRADGPLEAAIYIETIPFDETRDYVRKVMSNTVYYAKLFGQSTFTLKQRMGVIAGKNDKKRAGTDGQ